jgi:L-threonylcarbamoyladenylate synthase
LIRLAGMVAAGGVVVFPADTVYGLACDPGDPAAVRRVYELKGRPQDKPAAVMWFHRDAVDIEVGERVRAAMDALLPGPVTLLIDNPEHRYPLACGPDPSVIGVRVPDIPNFALWRRPIMQTSANLSGGPDARRLEDVPEPIRTGADLCIDGGELPGTASTVIDLRRYEDSGEWDVVREGAVPRDAVAGALAT